MTNKCIMDNLNIATPFLVSQFTDTRSLARLKKTCKSINESTQIDSELNSKERLQNVIKKIVKSDLSKYISYWFIASNIGLLISAQGLSAISESEKYYDNKTNEANKICQARDFLYLSTMTSVLSLAILAVTCSQNELTHEKIQRIFNVKEMDQEEHTHSGEDGISQFKILQNKANKANKALTVTFKNTDSIFNDLRAINTCEPDSIEVT